MSRRRHPKALFIPDRHHQPSAVTRAASTSLFPSAVFRTFLKDEPREPQLKRSVEPVDGTR